MAGHGRTSWDDVAVVTVSILRLVARYEKQNGGACFAFSSGDGESCWRE